MYTFNKENFSIKRAIVETIVFFDMFDFPLTDFEIRKFLMTKAKLYDIQRVLSSGELDSYIDKENGFYFLRGRSGIVVERMRKYSFTDRKFKRAIWVINLLTILPWVRMVAIGNIIGPHNLRNDSDIDFFVVTKSGRLWMTRFFSVFFMKILGLRPDKKKSRDKICLSFFVSEEISSLNNMMINGDDYYFVYWLAGLAPIFDNGFYNNFIAKNDWIYSYLPNWSPVAASRWRRKMKRHIIFNFVFNLAGFLEKPIKFVQIWLMPKSLKEMANIDTKVVFNDLVVKTHLNDRRKMYQDKFKEKLKEYENIK